MSTNKYQKYKSVELGDQLGERGGADTGWTNDVKRLEALTMTEQII